MRVVLVWLAALCAAVGLAVQPAFAHDRLLEADPADGASVSAEEFRAVTLSYSAEPLDLGNQVVVKDSKGEVLFEGEPKVEGVKAVAELEKAPAPGEVTVQWRVVSSDGHPISGSLKYTVTGGDEAGNDPSEATDAGGDGAPASDGGSATEATVEPVKAPDDANSQEGESAGWMLWLPLAGISVLAIAAGVFIAMRSRDDDSE